MSGVAIVSLDCEGKWGIADHLQAGGAERLTDARLRAAYEAIAATLDAHETPATFAFVELFLTPDRARQLDLTRMLASDQPYLRDAATALESGDQGWSAPWALDLLHDRHEIATHGFSHTPWTQLTEAQAAREIELVPAERRWTMVYPRNLVAHAPVLERHGCIGYRGARPAGTRLGSLASEFNLFTASEPPGEAALPTRIPAGVFINWLSGGRRLVPPALTRLRARRIIAHAARTGGVAHFWTHPENIATHPETIKNFNAVIEEIARASERGAIRAMTQSSFLVSGEQD
jgi:hypothetical protein